MANYSHSRAAGIHIHAALGAYAMKPNALFSIDEVHRLGRFLEERPEHQRTEVTRREAIRILAPQIAGLQSKGYTIAAIASMLSGHGVDISPVVLHTYLRDVRAKHSHKKKRTRVKARVIPTTEEVAPTPAAVRTSAPAPGPALGPSTATGKTAQPTAGQDSRGEEARSVKGPRPGLDAGQATLPPRGPIGAGGAGSRALDVPGPRQGSFSARRDSEDI